MFKIILVKELFQFAKKNTFGKLKVKRGGEFAYKIRPRRFRV